MTKKELDKVRADTIRQCELLFEETSDKCRELWNARERVDNALWQQYFDAVDTYLQERALIIEGSEEDATTSRETSYNLERR